jgi:glycerol-3-phosphate acyltransferase PlsY
LVYKEVLALVIAYLLGSIPSAYLAARIVKGQDIRRLGGGNIGGLNTFKSVGKLPGVIVLVVDIGKGAAAVAIAYWGLGVPDLFVMLAGLLSVIGHMWMIFLKFSGGRGMGPTLGAVISILCIYGNWLGLGIFLILIVIPIGITRNVPLSMAVALVGLPFIAWFTSHSATATILAVALALLTGGKFLPTGIKDIQRLRNRKKSASGNKSPGANPKGNG